MLYFQHQAPIGKYGDFSAHAYLDSLIQNANEGINEICPDIRHLGIEYLRHRKV